MEVPHPLSVEVTKSEGDIRIVLADILALTKINYNTYHAQVCGCCGRRAHRGAQHFRQPSKPLPFIRMTVQRAELDFNGSHPGEIARNGTGARVRSFR